MGLHVVIGDRHPILFLQTVRKSIRSLQRLNHENVVGRSEFHQQHCRYRGLRDIEVAHLLRYAILNNPEVLLLQARDKLAVLGGDQHVYIHERNVYFQRIVRKVLDFLRSDGRRGRCVFGFFLWNSIRTHIICRPTGFRRSFLPRFAIILSLRLCRRGVRRRLTRLILSCRQHGTAH